MHILVNIIDDFVSLGWSFIKMIFNLLCFFTKKKEVVFGKRKKNSKLELIIPHKKKFVLDHIWYIQELFDHILIDGRRYKYIEIIITEHSVNGIRYLLNNFADPILSFHITKIERDELYTTLKKQLNTLYEEKYREQNNAIHISSFIDIEIKNVQDQIEQLMQRKYGYMITVHMRVGMDVDDRLFKLFSSLFHTETYPLYFNQIKGINSLFGVTKQKGSIVSNIEKFDVFAAFNPIYNKGVFVGKQSESNSPLFEDFFSNENYNSVIMAKSGAGKTFLAMLLIKRLLFEKVNIIVFDPEGEYGSLVKRFDGMLYEENALFEIDGYMINTNDIEYVKNIIPIIFSEDEQSEINYLFHSVTSFDMYNSIKSNLSTVQQQKIDAAINIFAKSINNSHLMVFHVSSDDSRIALYKIIYYALHRNYGKTILVVDEAHKVMDDEYIAKFMRQVAKRGRKYDLGICVISQDILDFIQNKSSKAIISNASVKFILKQEPINIPLINKTFNLDGYDDFLEHANIGEGLFVKGDEIKKLHFDDI